MSTRVIVLNGGSSSGKSGLVRCLQAVLPQPWLAFGIDRLIEMMPTAMQISADGIDVASDGAVAISAKFRELEQAWMVGVAATVRAGVPAIVDDVFLGGATSQQRWLDALGDLPTLWVGVRCDPAVAAGREIARGDRVPGMAVAQAELVHKGVRYDLEVDTSHTESIDCARAIVAALG